MIKNLMIITTIISLILFIIYYYNIHYKCKNQDYYIHNLKTFYQKNFNASKFFVEKVVLEKNIDLISYENVIILMHHNNQTTSSHNTILYILHYLYTHNDIYYILNLTHDEYKMFQYSDLLKNSRDTYLTVLCKDDQINIKIVQRSDFIFYLLFYIIHHRSFDILHNLLKPYVKSDQSYISTSFFTIYHSTLSIPSFKFSLKSHIRENTNFIFQTWIDNGTNIQYIYDCHLQLKNMYPQYSYILFTDYSMKQFIRKYYPSFYVHQYDNLLPSAFKSDFFRYLFLYKFGGFYLDISIKNIENIDNHLRKYYPNQYFTFISATDNHHISNIYNAFMISVPGHPFLKYCIDKILTINKTNHLFTKCLNFTGPGLLGEAISELGIVHNNYLLFDHDTPYIINNNVKLFTTKLLDPSAKIGHSMYAESNKNHYTEHCLYDRIVL